MVFGRKNAFKGPVKLFNRLLERAWLTTSEREATMIAARKPAHAVLLVDGIITQAPLMIGKANLRREILRLRA